MVRQFLLYNKVNQLYAYVYPHIPSLLRLPPTLPIPPLQVITKHRADLPVLCGCFPLAINFTFGSSHPSSMMTPFLFSFRAIFLKRVIYIYELSPLPHLCFSSEPAPDRSQSLAETRHSHTFSTFIFFHSTATLSYAIITIYGSTFFILSGQCIFPFSFLPHCPLFQFPLLDYFYLLHL